MVTHLRGAFAHSLGKSRSNTQTLALATVCFITLLPPVQALTQTQTQTKDTPQNLLSSQVGNKAGGLTKPAKPANPAKPITPITGNTPLWDSETHLNHFGDFDGDGKPDVVLQARVAGESHSHLSNIHNSSSRSMITNKPLMLLRKSTKPVCK